MIEFDKMKKKIFIACSVPICGMPEDIRSRFDEKIKEIEEKENVEIKIVPTEVLNEEISLDTIKENIDELEKQRKILKDDTKSLENKLKDNKPWYNKFPTHPNRKKKSQ